MIFVEFVFHPFDRSIIFFFCCWITGCCTLSQIFRKLNVGNEVVLGKVYLV